MKNLMKFMLVFAFAAAFAACGKNVKENASADGMAGKGSMTEITAEDIIIMGDDDAAYGVGMISGATVNLAPVFFTFDRFYLSKEAMAVLDANVAALKARGAGVVVTVEGHTDERGTIAYNIALGDKRAKEVKDYYVKRGIKAGNVRTISYGKERPVCFEAKESCWAKNRRGETIIR